LVSIEDLRLYFAQKPFEADALDHDSAQFRVALSEDFRASQRLRKEGDLGCYRHTAPTEADVA